MKVLVMSEETLEAKIAEADGLRLQALSLGIRNAEVQWEVCRDALVAVQKAMTSITIPEGCELAVVEYAHELHVGSRWPEKVYRVIQEVKL